MSSPQVLIVGSGPAGLVLALSLIRNGIPVRIIEKDAQHHHGIRGPGVMPRTLEIEHFFGIDEEVLKTGWGPLTLHTFDPKNPYQTIRSSMLVEDVEPSPAFPFTKSISISQWRHQAILRRAIEALGGQVELGTSFTDFTENEDDVTVEMRKNVEGTEKTEKANFNYVIGADGGRSSVRKALGVNFLGETHDDVRLRIVDARATGIECDNDIFMWGSHATAWVALRHTNEKGVFQIMFAGPEADLDGVQAWDDIQAVQKVFNRITGRIDLTVAEIIWHGEWRANIRLAEHFQKGHVFLIGDAAHTHSPAGGQGLNSSIQDAFNLGWKLALTLKGRASDKLLDSYESERLPVIAEMLKMTTRLLARDFQLDDVQAQAIRDAATTTHGLGSKAEGDAFSRDRKLFQLDLHYRWSPIIFDERYPGLHTPSDVYGVAGHDTRAGDRAPDAPSLVGENAPSRLFDIFNPALHTILIFVALHSLADKANKILAPFSLLDAGLFQKVLVLPAGQQVPNIDVRYAVVDTEGHAFGGYGISPTDEAPTIVVVRPDAMIGAFLKSDDGAREYLSAAFK